MVDFGESEKRFKAFYWITLGLLAALIVAMGLVYSVKVEERQRDAMARELTAIAELKVADIVQWREERIGDGTVFRDNANFADLLRRLVSDRGDAAAADGLRTLVRQIRGAYGYDRVFLLGPGGEAMLSDPPEGPMDPAIAAAVPETLRKGKVGILDLYRDRPDGRIYLSVLAPIGETRPIGALALRIDPEKSLYPSIERWPTASRTAETLLVRREGEDVLFLNRIRFQNESALTLRFRIADHPELPAAQAALGRQGVFAGRDYRGEKVLSSLLRVPDSPWALVARIDRSEVDTGSGERRLTLLVLVLALLGCEVAVMIAMVKCQGLEYYKLKSAAAADLRGLNAELEERIAQRTSQLAASNDALEAFAYSVAHDLRAPLRSIDGFSRVLGEEYGPVLDAEGARILGIIKGSARKMDSLISNLLEISRLGSTALSISRIDMRALAGTAFTGIAGPDAAGNLDFRVGALPEADADAPMMERVWGNLLSNAVKYSAPGPTRLIEVGGHEDGGTKVYFVKDSGVGFDPRYADKLFGMFQRLHDEKDFPGNGVGLAIVQKIVSRHGGKVWAEGRPGKGATFYFSLPSRS